MVVGGFTMVAVVFFIVFSTFIRVDSVISYCSCVKLRLVKITSDY